MDTTHSAIVSHPAAASGPQGEAIPTLAHVESEHIRRVLESCGGNVRGRLNCLDCTAARCSGNWPGCAPSTGLSGRLELVEVRKIRQDARRCCREGPRNAVSAGEKRTQGEDAEGAAD